MSLLIGMDEAGLGPNLGPYVVTATVWDVPGRPDEIDLWQEFAEIVTEHPQPGDDRLHIGDSKAVFHPGKGLAELERGVLTATRLLPGRVPATDRELRERLSNSAAPLMGTSHWYAAPDCCLPVECPAAVMESMAARWQAIAGTAGIRLQAIRIAVIEPDVFNALIDQHGNKAEALSTVSLQLLASVVPQTEGEPVLAVCDKHGGRNRYDRLLSACFDDAFVFRICESAERSIYRLGNLEIRFQPRAETQFPVALASMVSKYVRELAMLRWNRFWQECMPGLKPTQGYPVDARRFRESIAGEARQRGLPEACWWRMR